nr:hypothetical protein [Gloiopeltis furcata]
MNFFQITFFNDYLISPKIWLHSIKSFVKISFIFIILCLLPYFNYIYINLYIIGVLLILKNIKTPSRYFKYIYNVIILILVFLLNYSNGQYSKMSRQITFIINTSSTQKLIITCCNMIDIKNTGHLQYKLSLPEYIVKSVLVSISYFASLKILYLSTRYEEIILICLISYLKISKNHCDRLVLTVILGSQLLVSMQNRVNIIRIGMRLKGLNGYTHYYFYYFAIIEFFILTHYNIRSIASVLYCREIKYSKFLIADIYT